MTSACRCWALGLLVTLSGWGWALPSRAQTKVACVGDSITAGYGLAASEVYPAVLQTLLGDEYEVGNFGVSGATLMKSGDRPYASEPQYAASAGFAPDIVVLMLGTNDSKPQNWAHEGEFELDYTELVTYYRDAGAEVFVGVPPPVYEPGAFDISPQVVNNAVSAHVRELAVSLAAPLIDVFAALDEQPQLFPDTVHPNAEGARVLAQVVHDALIAADAAPGDGRGGSAGDPDPVATGAAVGGMPSLPPSQGGASQGASGAAYGSGSTNSPTASSAPPSANGSNFVPPTAATLADPPTAQPPSTGGCSTPANQMGSGTSAPVVVTSAAASPPTVSPTSQSDAPSEPAASQLQPAAVTTQTDPEAGVNDNGSGCTCVLARPDRGRADTAWFWVAIAATCSGAAVLLFAWVNSKAPPEPRSERDPRAASSA